MIREVCLVQSSAFTCQVKILSFALENNFVKYINWPYVRTACPKLGQATIVVEFFLLMELHFCRTKLPIVYSDSFEMNCLTLQLQGDQLNMAVYFWYLAKRDLSSVHMYKSIHLTRPQKNTAMFNWLTGKWMESSTQINSGTQWNIFLGMGSRFVDFSIWIPVHIAINLVYRDQANIAWSLHQETTEDVNVFLCEIYIVWRDEITLFGWVAAPITFHKW